VVVLWLHFMIMSSLKGMCSKTLSPKGLWG